MSAEEQIQGELAEGINQAVRDHAQVISMSIGYSAPSGAVRAALQYAYDHGIVLVASAGNSGDNDEQHTRSGDHGWAPVSFPAEYPGVLSVGAVNMDKQPTSFSSGNLSVKVAAPGRGGPRPGQERPVLHRQRHQPGLRAGGGRGRADQVEVPVDHARPGDAGADDHRPAADAGRQLQRAHRLRHRERGRGADRGGQAGRASARPAPRSRCRRTSAAGRRRSRPRR